MEFQILNVGVFFQKYKYLRARIKNFKHQAFMAGDLVFIVTGLPGYYLYFPVTTIISHLSVLMNEDTSVVNIFEYSSIRWLSSK